MYARGKSGRSAKRRSVPLSARKRRKEGIVERPRMSASNCGCIISKTAAVSEDAIG